MAAPLRLISLGRLAIWRPLTKGALHTRCGQHKLHTIISTTQSWSCKVSNQNMQEENYWSYTSHRNINFLTSKPALHLWEGVTGVSNAGKKKGRGKRVGRKKTTDLNRGQVLGTGKENMLWPGLNAPVIRGRAVMEMKKLPPNPDYEKELLKIRDEMSRISYQAPPPLLRGWSGGRYPGQSVGPPDRVTDWFALAKAQNGRAAIRMAKNKAAQRLQYIERFEDSTVYHNMYTKFHRTKIFIHKKEKGNGLVCHRALKTICELIGIKDLHCKVEGSTKNIQALTKGFFDVLSRQETHQDLADRMGYHVVEFRKEKNYKPEVVATPSHMPVNKKQLMDEEEDLEVAFERLYNDGKVEYKRPKKKFVYEGLNSWRAKQKVVHANRNQKAVSLLRQAGLA